MTEINSIIAEKDIELDGYIYLLHDGQYYRGCKRCGGTGHYSFNGFDSICYECGNAAYAKLGVCVGDLDGAKKDAHKRLKAREAGDRKREAKRLAALKAREDAQLAIKATHPDVYEFLMSEAAYESRNGFIASMAHLFQIELGGKRYMSEKMIAAVKKCIATDKERAAAAALIPPVPTEGRQTITGTILSTKTVEGDFGTAYKILVQDDRGFKVYGSIPKAQADEACEQFEDAYLAEHGVYPGAVVGYSVWFLGSSNEPERFPGLKGRRIRFDAAIQASDDDKSFGFASRPTKGAWLA